MPSISVRKRRVDEPEIRDAVIDQEAPEAGEGGQATRQLAVGAPPQLAGLPDKLDEWDGLAPRDRQILTPAVVDRWTRNLHPDDYTLTDLIRAERLRRTNLTTLRAGELTDMEWKMWSYLKRHEGRTCTYLEIAKWLWDRPGYRVTAKLLAAQHGYAAPMIGNIWNLAHHLRQKLEVDPLRPQHLATVRGAGYAWYDNPPALDDGVNYDARADHNAMLREEVREQLGLIEGQYAAIGAPTGRTVLVDDGAVEDSAPPSARIDYRARPVLPLAPDDDSDEDAAPES